MSLLMTKTLEFIKCPLCNKCSPVKHVSFNTDGFLGIGEIQVRKCQGKKGFPLEKKISLSTALATYPLLAKNILDACSKIIMSVMDKPLPFDKSKILRIINELEGTIKMVESLPYEKKKKVF